MEEPLDLSLGSLWENRLQQCKPSLNLMQLTKQSLPQVQTWFDIKVFYVRVSSCLPEEAPASLLIAYPSRPIHTELEVNGCRISPSERACFTLRRDRADTGSAEATYVSTNNLRTTGDLAFEIHDKDELLVHGTLIRSDMAVDEHSGDGHGSSPVTGNETRWSMDCNCGITSPTCSFLKGRVDFSAVNPTMEVYVAGRSSGLPIVLTQTLQLSLRKKSLRYCTLDVIPEDEEPSSDQIIAGQVVDEQAYAKFANQSFEWTLANNFYIPGSEAYGESEDGELTWFNAGVRVGVGIGLGLCLGVGLGVGLLMKTYHATTGPFRRRLL